MSQDMFTWYSIPSTVVHCFITNMVKVNPLGHFFFFFSVNGLNDLLPLSLWHSLFWQIEGAASNSTMLQGLQGKQKVGSAVYV
jgi:hypothetical protein